MSGSSTKYEDDATATLVQELMTTAEGFLNGQIIPGPLGQEFAGMLSRQLADHKSIPEVDRERCQARYAISLTRQVGQVDKVIPQFKRLVSKPGNPRAIVPNATAKLYLAHYTILDGGPTAETNKWVEEAKRDLADNQLSSFHGWAKILQGITDVKNGDFLKATDRINAGIKLMQTSSTTPSSELVDQRSAVGASALQ
jgi:hypothetical protein